ncbi:prostatic spermine-binding protein-like [Impatiens glandulifera]|uniref:prostatic spermine-binding protein-like n=1 Tax=Impatiens glandulifera TaxID=253017 RepID=UPI001FB058C2|nr:prostatic spermine-binding protein-like [Impatiens glandulifera]
MTEKRTERIVKAEDLLSSYNHSDKIPEEETCPVHWNTPDRTSNIACPCVKCGNRSYLDRDIVKSHLIVYGIRQSYTFWYCHGEKRSRSYEEGDNDELEGDNDELEGDNDELEDDNDELEGDNDELDGDNDELVDDNDELEGDNDEDSDNDVQDSNRGNDSEESHEEDKAFCRLLNDSKQPLYQGSRI